MKKRIAVIMAISLLIALTVQARHHGEWTSKADCAQDGSRLKASGEKGMGAGMILKLADKLELDDKQKAEIRQLMEKNGLARIDKEAELEKAELKLRHLRMNNASEEDILSGIDRVGKLKTEMQKMRFQHRNQIKSIMTDEQLEKFENLRQDFRHSRPGRDKHIPGRSRGFDTDFDSDNSGYDTPRRPGCWRR